jgi:hypothetical protein
METMARFLIDDKFIIDKELNAARMSSASTAEPTDQDTPDAPPHTVIASAPKQSMAPPGMDGFVGCASSQ